MSVSVIRQSLLKFPYLRGQQALAENDRTGQSSFRYLYLLLKVGIGLLVTLFLFAVVRVVPVA